MGILLAYNVVVGYATNSTIQKFILKIIFLLIQVLQIGGLVGFLNN